MNTHADPLNSPSVCLRFFRIAWGPNRPWSSRSATTPLPSLYKVLPAPTPRIRTGSGSSPFLDLRYSLLLYQAAMQSREQIGNFPPLADGRQKYDSLPLAQLWGQEQSTVSCSSLLYKSVHSGFPSARILLFCSGQDRIEYASRCSSTRLIAWRHPSSRISPQEKRVLATNTIVPEIL